MEIDQSSGTQSAVADPSAEPDVQALVKEFQRCGSTGNYWGRTLIAEETRLAIWEGQSADGRKHDEAMPEGKQAFPWENASDVRCYQSDEVCNENVALLTAAFWRADLRINATNSASLAGASQATSFIRWLVHQKLTDQFDEEVELAAQYGEWYGWCGLHVSWEREIAYRTRKVKLEELLQLSQQVQQAPAEQMNPEQRQTMAEVAIFPELIQRPESEPQAVAVIQSIYRTWVLNNLPKDLQEEDIATLDAKTARKFIRDLRKKQEANLPMPYLCKNQPCISALKPWRELVVPTDTTSIQRCRQPFIRWFMSEADVRAMVKSDGWDADWVEAAVKTKGHISAWTYNAQSNILVTFPEWVGQQTDNQLIEVIWSYERKVDAEGVAGIYYTVFSAHAHGDGKNNNLYAKSGLLDYPATIGYPIVVHRRERLDRHLLASRGIPEIFSTSQREEKALRDAIIDNTSISVIPPINVPKGTMGQRYRFGPAVQNDVYPGREPKMMDIPTQGVNVALEALALVEKRVDRYNGRFAEDVSPAYTQVMLEPKVRKFLSSWAKALWMAYQLALKFAPEMVEKVTGYQVDADAETAEMNFILHFDVTQFSPEIMEKKLKAFSDLRLEDSAGVIDPAKLVEMKARMIDPAMAQELIQDNQSANKRLRDNVSTDLLKMFAGSEADYEDASDDPTASAKMNFMRQILGRNVKYMSALEPKLLAELGVLQPGQQLPPMITQAAKDPLFSQYVMNYAKNLHLGMQQMQNKMIGKTGVRQP